MLPIHLVEDTEPFEREVRVECFDLAAVAYDDARGAAGGYDADALLAELFARAADEGVYGASVAVDEAATNGVGGVGGYGVRGFLFEVNARELGGAGDEGVEGDVEAGEDRAPEVAGLAVHGLDGGGGADVHYDGREPVVVSRRHRVDDPVRPYRRRVVVAVLEAGLHVRVHQVERDPEHVLGEVPVRACEPGNDARDDQGAHLCELQ